MPRLSVWMIRAALIYLLLGFTLGALLLAQKGISYWPALWDTLPAHVEFVLFGWTVQLALGMAFWILPRFSKAPKRGNEKVAWGSFLLLNLGIWLASFAALDPQGRLLFAARLAEVGAAVLFAIHAWPRVKPVGA